MMETQATFFSNSRTSAVPEQLAELHLWPLALAVHWLGVHGCHVLRANPWCHVCWNCASSIASLPKRRGMTEKCIPAAIASIFDDKITPSQCRLTRWGEMSRPKNTKVNNLVCRCHAPAHLPALPQCRLVIVSNSVWRRMFPAHPKQYGHRDNACAV